MFDILENTDAQAQAANGDPLDRFLAALTEPITDPILYWHARVASTPGLVRMGLDYSTIPGELNHHCTHIHSYRCSTATTVDVERTFSKGHLTLSHVRNRLNAQTTHALMCVGAWSCLDLIDTDDLHGTVGLPDLEGDEEFEMDEG